MQRCDKEYVHGQLAVEAARIQGILPEGDTIWEADEDDKVSIATGDATVTLHNWRLEMEQLSISTNDAEVDDNEKQLIREGRVLALSDLWEKTTQERMDALIGDEVECLAPCHVENLNDNQY